MTTFRELPFGFSWIQDEAMQRTSHALADEGRVWLVDPVDSDGAVERAQGLGDVTAVVQLLDRHERDAEAIARRLGVPHLRLPEEMPGTPFEVVRVLDWPKWVERALWWPARRTLVVAEALGTSAWFVTGDAPVGVHGMLRPLPPRRQLGGFAPDHLLVGHGAPVDGEAARNGPRRALDGARRDLPRWLLGLPKLLRDSS